MRKHINIQIVLTLFLALITGISARAQTFAAYSNAVVNLSPLGFWPLQETAQPLAAGPAAINAGSLGAAGNGTYAGGVFLGMSGALSNSTDTSAYFDAYSGVVTVPYNAGLIPPAINATNYAFTAEAWINQPYTNTGTEYILSVGNFGNPVANPTIGYSGFRFRISSARLAALLYNTNTTTSSVTLTAPVTSLVTPGVWTHVALTYDGTNLNIYQDGTNVATSSAITPNTIQYKFVPDDGSSSTTLAVGASPNLTAASFFKGGLDEVAYYTHALTAAQVLAHYQAGTNTTLSATAYSALVTGNTPAVYFHLNEASYLTAQATNYGTGGASGNGIYLIGTQPGQTGPTAQLGAQVKAVGFPAAAAVTGRTAGEAAGPGPAVEIAPFNDNLFNIVGNPNGNSNTTIFAWVQYPPSNNWFQTIATRGGTANNTWRLNLETVALPFAQGGDYPAFVDGGTLDVIDPNQVADGNWHFFAGVYNQTNNTAYTYVDGNLAAQAVQTGPVASTLEPFLVGADSQFNGRNFVGSVMGLAVFTNALTQAQLAGVFDSVYGGIITQPPATVTYASGASISISSAVEGSFIQWYTGTPGSGTAVATGASGEISGAGTETLTFSPPGTADFTTYFVIVGNGTTLANSTLMSTSTVVTLSRAVGANSVYGSTVQALNPVGYWPLNDTTGNIAYNYSTNGSVLNGIYSAVTNCPLQQGVAGPAVFGAGGNNLATQFSTQGTRDTTDTRTGVVINDPALMNITGNVSVAMWVQFSTAYGIEEVYGQQDSTLIRYSVFGTGNSQMDFVDGGNDVENGPQLNDGTWHFWAATYNTTNKVVSEYLDNVFIGAGVETANGASTQLTCIGSAPDDTGRNFIGSVCQVANFAAVLTPAQIATLWNVGYNGIITQPPAIEYYAAGAATVTVNLQAPYIQWYKGGTPGVPGTGTPVVNGTEASGTVISGANTGTLTFTPPSAGDFATYYVVVGNGTTLANSTITTVSTAVTLSQLTSPNGAYDQAVLAYNPLAYWPLNETSGTIAYNYATNGLAPGGLLNGVIEEYGEAPNLLNLPGPAVNGFGGADVAIGFGTSDGVNYVGTENALPAARSGVGVIITSPVLDSATNHSVAAWAQIPNGLNLGNQGYIYGQRRGYGIQLGQSSGNIFVEDDNNTSTTAVTGTGLALSDGNWHLWVETYNGTNKLVTVYIDGTSFLTVTEGAPVFTATPTAIGSDYPGGTTRNWNGQICRVAEFTNTLTPAQVAALYTAAGVAPFFTANPPSIVVANAGSAVTIGNVATGGSAPIAITWYHGALGSGTPLTPGGRFTATSSNLVINPVLASDAGSYYAGAANNVTTTLSTLTTLTVITNASDNIYAGQSPVFNVGAGATSYVWYTNGVIDAAATTNTYTLHSVTIALNNGEKVYAVLNGNQYSVTNTLNVLAAPVAAYPTAVLGDHPLAFYRLDEADNGAGNNGTVAHDYINGYNGLYHNDGTPADLVPGIPGVPYGNSLPANTDTAASFGTLGTGAIDNTPAGPSNNFAGFIPTIDFSVAISNSPAQPGDGEFSVEAWVYAQEGQANGGIVTKGYGLGDGNTVAGFFEQFSLQISDVGSTGSRYDFCVHDAQGNLASAESGSFYTGYQNPPGLLFTTGTAYWQHLVGVCDQTNGVVTLYVNGAVAATGAIKKGNGIMSTPVPVSIGAKQAGSTSGNYSGQLQGYVDEVAIYNYALTSNQVQNHYFAAGILPLITLQPTNAIGIGAGGTTNAPQGSSVTLKSVAFGSPTLNYQWYDYNNGGAPIAVSAANEPGSSGANTPNLTLVNVSGNAPNTIGTGTFFVAVSNPYGTTNSAPVTINAVPGAPIIQTDLPTTSYALMGSSAVFTAQVNGSFPQTNAWYFNNGTSTVKLANGGRYTLTTGTSPTLTVANVTASDQGTYQLFITNAVSYPSAVSSTASALVVEYEPTFNGNGSGWTLNTGAGQAAGPSIANNQLQLTTAGDGGQVASFFFNTPLYVGGFQAHFTYTPTSSTTAADGTCFVIQNSAAGAAAIGGGGGDLGVNGITPSVEFEMSLYSTPQVYGFVSNGASIEMGAPTFRLAESPGGGGGYSANGDTKDVTLTYVGGNLSIVVSNEVTANVGFTNLNVGDITQVLGTNVALFGFTASTGGFDSTQVVGNFTFTPLPTLAAAAAGANVVLTWPTAIGGYVLQSSSTVNGPYTTSGAASSVVNGNNQVIVPKSQGTTFYRLVVP